MGNVVNINLTTLAPSDEQISDALSEASKDGGSNEEIVKRAMNILAGDVVPIIRSDAGWYIEGFGTGPRDEKAGIAYDDSGNFSVRGIFVNKDGEKYLADLNFTSNTFYFRYLLKGVKIPTGFIVRSRVYEAVSQFGFSLDMECTFMTKMCEFTATGNTSGRSTTFRIPWENDPLEFVDTLLEEIERLPKKIG